MALRHLQPPYWVLCPMNKAHKSTHIQSTATTPVYNHTLHGLGYPFHRGGVYPTDTVSKSTPTFACSFGRATHPPLTSMLECMVEYTNGRRYHRWTHPAESLAVAAASVGPAPPSAGVAAPLAPLSLSTTTSPTSTAPGKTQQHPRSTVRSAQQRAPHTSLTPLHTLSWL